jgi:poly(A) polymerase
VKSKLSENSTLIRQHLSHPIFGIISETAEETGMPAYAIGGYVRDIFLQRASKDIDIVVAGSGIEFAKALATKIGDVQVNYYKNFGTAMLRYKEVEVEFVGARKESYMRDSRKPIVEDGTLEDDQNRRDFTINALALSLNKADFGTLVDPFGGITDLENEVIRTPLEPNITYSDDPLRMMRAIRFASQLGFFIEEKSLNAIKENKDRISIVSKERIIDELNKIILAPKPSVGFKLLFKTELLQIIFPELANLYGVETRNGKSHKDNFYHTLQVLDNISPNTDNLWLRWSAILHDIAKPATKRFFADQGWTFHGHEDRGARMVPKIFKNLKLPLDSKMKYVQKLVMLHLRPIALTNEWVTDSAARRLIFEAGEDLEDLMTLCEADITTKNKLKEKRYLERFEQVRQKLKAVEERDKIRDFQPPISGELIMDTYNLKPCREVGVIKQAIKDAILDGAIKNDYEEAFEYMLLQGKEIGLTPHIKNHK